VLDPVLAPVGRHVLPSRSKQRDILCTGLVENITVAILECISMPEPNISDQGFDNEEQQHKREVDCLIIFF